MTPITSLREEAEPSNAERSAFELWAKPLFFSLLRCLHDTEQYDSLTTEAAWMAWQARASHPEYRSSGERGEADAAGVLGTPGGQEK